MVPVSKESDRSNPADLAIMGWLEVGSNPPLLQCNGMERLPGNGGIIFIGFGLGFLEEQTPLPWRKKLDIGFRDGMPRRENQDGISQWTSWGISLSSMFGDFYGYGSGSVGIYGSCFALSFTFPSPLPISPKSILSSISLPYTYYYYVFSLKHASSHNPSQASKYGINILHRLRRHRHPRCGDRRRICNRRRRPSDSRDWHLVLQGEGGGGSEEAAGTGNEGGRGFLKGLVFLFAFVFLFPFLLLFGFGVRFAWMRRLLCMIMVLMWYDRWSEGQPASRQCEGGIGRSRWRTWRWNGWPEEGILNPHSPVPTPIIGLR